MIVSRNAAVGAMEVLLGHEPCCDVESYCHRESSYQNDANSQHPWLPTDELPVEEAWQGFNCALQEGNNFQGVEQCVDLGKFQTFYLLQDRETQWFYIWEEQTTALCLSTESWTEAYRSWLQLQQYSAHPKTCTPSFLSAATLHATVTDHQDSPCFGQLLYNRDRSHKGVLNYLVQVSETLGLCWSGMGEDLPGAITLEKLGRRQHRPAKWIESQPPAAIAETLHAAIETFHQRWPYSLYRFNSEHWARLMVTGQCASFQSDEILSYWRQVDTLEDTETALPEIIEQNIAAETALKVTLHTPAPVSP